MVWLKRLYTDPTTGELVQMDSRSRAFEGAVGEFLELRDQWCRSAWCGARIRHRDHVTGYQHSGVTRAEDGQGLCEACNYAKQGTGWSARPVRGPDGEHVVVTTTPTGHHYRSRAPSLVEPEPDPPPSSSLPRAS
jgi:hypothetical protein